MKPISISQTNWWSYEVHEYVFDISMKICGNSYLTKKQNPEIALPDLQIFMKSGCRGVFLQLNRRWLVIPINRKRLFALHIWQISVFKSSSCHTWFCFNLLKYYIFSNYLNRYSIYSLECAKNDKESSG